VYEEVKSSKITITSIDAYEKFIESIKPEKEYGDYLKNKRVAFVGPSKYLFDSEIGLGEKHGELIDDYDIVARIKCIPLLPFEEKLSPEKIRFIGNRVDVIYNWTAVNSKDHKMMNGIYEHNVQYIRIPNSVKAGTVQTTSTALHHGRPWNPVLKHNIENCSCHHINFDISGYREYCSALKSMPTNLSKRGRALALQTGSAGLMELIASDCREIYITGITYYHGGDNMFEKKKKGHAAPVVGKHNAAVEIRLLVDALLYEIEKYGNLNRIKVDNVLKFIILQYVGMYHSNDPLKWYDDVTANSIKKKVEKRFGVSSSD